MILFSCRRVAEISSLELDARPRLTERLSAGAHRLMCRDCRSYRAQLRALHRAVAESVRDESDGTGPALPDEAKARIASNLDSATRDPGPAP